MILRTCVYFLLVNSALGADRGHPPPSSPPSPPNETQQQGGGSNRVRIYGSKEALSGFLSQNQNHFDQVPHIKKHQPPQPQPIQPSKPQSQYVQPPRPRPQSHPHPYSSTSSQNNLESFNEIHDHKKQNEQPNGPRTKEVVPSKGGAVAHDKSDNNKKTSPALSALALMGFLYFLNRMQDVLQGRRRRRRESVSMDGGGGGGEEEERIEQFFSAVEGAINQAVSLYSGEGGAAAAAAAEGRSSSGLFAYVRSLLASIPRALGLTTAASSRNDDFDFGVGGGGGGGAGGEEGGGASAGFWSLFGSRVGLVAKIMDFLDDPSPDRVGRATKIENENTELNPEMEYAEALDLSEEEETFLPSFSATQNKEEEGGGGGAAETGKRRRRRRRRKRFTKDEMNVWYSEAAAEGGRDDDETYGGVNGRVLGMVLNLFKNALTS